MTSVPPTAALQLDLVLRAPTVIARRPTAPGQISETPGYLTGTVLRGGIAEAWLAARRRAGVLPNSEQEQFTRIFLDAEVRFGNGLPVGDGTIWVVPRTARAKKRGGWRVEQYEGVQDVLTRILRDAPFDDLDALGGDDAFVLEERRTGDWRPLRPSRRLTTRTALSPARGESLGRGAAEDGQLYSLEALETGSRFRATLLGPEPLLETLHQLLKTHPQLTIGQGRSRGHGLAEVLPLNQGPAARQVDESDQRHEAIRRFSALAAAPEGQLFLPVTLASDTLLRDQYLLPCSSAHVAAVLSNYLPDAPASMELWTAVQSSHWIGGWEAIRRRPRSPQLAIAQGSVWVFTVRDEELSAALDWWASAEADGLGERIGEGFGQVQLLHPFHRYSADDEQEERPW
jgi:CRISPR-associated Csx10 family RAMP protein